MGQFNLKKYNLKQDSMTIMIDTNFRIRDQHSFYGTFDIDITSNNTPIVCIKHNNPIKYDRFYRDEFNKILYQILKEDFYKI